MQAQRIVPFFKLFSFFFINGFSVGGSSSAADPRGLHPVVEESKNLVGNKLTFGQNLTLNLLNIMALSNKTLYFCSTV